MHHLARKYQKFPGGACPQTPLAVGAFGTSLCHIRLPHLKILATALPEAYVNFDSDGAYKLKTVPDVLGLHARQPGADVIKVLLGRDSQSVRALVPDVKVRDRGFHEVTLLDISNIAGPDVSIADLSLLHLQWPVPVVSRNMPFVVFINRAPHNSHTDPLFNIGLLYISSCGHFIHV